MTAAAVTCTLLALAAELVGIALLVREGKRATRSLQRWRAANPRNNPEGSYGQQMLLNDVIEHVLGSQARRGWAVTLLVAGVLLGTAGNLLGLQPT
ncbi:hypothetical protein [Blastococcus sp. TF02A-35]|uniref:hypothetical protein n=1 Tax=Blastococcus sp. TF02A-35 TaxID=2559612 RepID=UPI0010747395|nr:hypothetical protein [Blastococcus sp. TF02A_35]TFV52653.1 hypothetical protein E4P43_04965 [Blastococcus sp. TF02A_35]